MLRSPLERICLVALGLLTAVVFAILYMPVFIAALFSVVPVDRTGTHWDQATFEWYARLLDNPSVIDALRMSALVGVIAVAAATVIAIAIALYVQSEHAMFRGAIEVAIYLPFLMPPIVTGLSLLIYFNNLGIQRGVVTIAIGHTALVLAILYRLILTRLRSIPNSMLEASSDLGATRWQTFRHVIWPQLRSAAVTGGLLALAISFDETFITVFLGGDTTTLPLRLWGMMRVGFTPEINALVTIMLAASIALTVVASLRLVPRDTPRT